MDEQDWLKGQGAQPPEPGTGYVGSVVNEFDRVLSSRTDLNTPGSVLTRPTTVQDIIPIVGQHTTFTLQAYKGGDECLLFLQWHNSEGAQRVVLPTKATIRLRNLLNRLFDPSTPASRRRKAASAKREKTRKEKAQRKADWADRNK